MKRFVRMKRRTKPSRNIEVEVKNEYEKARFGQQIPSPKKLMMLKKKLNSPDMIMERMGQISKRRQELMSPGVWPYLRAEMLHLHVTGLNPEAIFINLPGYPMYLWFNITDGECFTEVDLHECEYYVGCYIVNNNSPSSMIAEITQQKRPLN